MKDSPSVPAAQVQWPLGPMKDIAPICNICRSFDPVANLCGTRVCKKCGLCLRAGYAEWPFGLMKEVVPIRNISKSSKKHKVCTMHTKWASNHWQLSHDMCTRAWTHIHAYIRTYICA